LVSAAGAGITPFFLVGGDVVVGRVGIDVLEKLGVGGSVGFLAAGELRVNHGVARALFIFAEGDVVLER
jgi:hypothetical protein